MNNDTHNKTAEIESQPAGDPNTEKLLAEKNNPDLSNLHRNLTEHFGLSHEAALFLRIIYDFSQFFDDLADGHEVTRREIDNNLYNAFVGLNSNPFFVANRAFLLPILDLIILKWQGSDSAERAGDADERSYMWRAAFYDLLMSVMSLVHGHEYATERATDIMHFYAEPMAEYRKEFSNG